jgi:hypothetical protein
MIASWIGFGCRGDGFVKRWSYGVGSKENEFVLDLDDRISFDCCEIMMNFVFVLLADDDDFRGGFVRLKWWMWWLWWLKAVVMEVRDEDWRFVGRKKVVEESCYGGESGGLS